MLVIDNPPMNALSFSLQGELEVILGEIAANDGIRAVIVASSSNKVFSAGAEISELDRLRDPLEADNVVGRLHEIFDRLERLPQPTFAAIEGAAVGGGTELAMACTFRVAGRSSKLGLPEVRLGLIPGGGGTQRLPRLVGDATALELILTGRVLTADEAHELGLVHRVVDVGQALPSAVEWATEVAQNPRVAVQAAKRAILMSRTADGYAAERSSFVRCCTSDDMAEGVEAFLAKRPPSFTHR